MLGVKSNMTTAYHTQANGRVERMHRQLKASLKARLTDGEWMDALPFVLLGLHSSCRDGAETERGDYVSTIEAIFAIPQVAKAIVNLEPLLPWSDGLHGQKLQGSRPTQ